MTNTKITYSDDFSDRAFVASTVKSWENGAESFYLRTSGSTGRPKKITLSRNLLIWSATSTKLALNLDSNQKILCCLPVKKTGGFMQLIRALYNGWDIHFINPTGSPLISVKDLNISLISLTPMQLQNSIKQKTLLSSISNVLIGGAKLNKRLEQKLHTLPNSYWETYGMTETASHIALRKIGYDNHFIPLQGVKLQDINNKLEITIEPLKLTLKTNDIVQFYRDGSFQVLGRSDNVINTGGLKVFPTDLESTISTIFEEHNINEPFYVSSEEDSKLGEKVILLMEKSQAFNSKQLLSILSSSIEKYLIPKKIYLVEKIEKTDTDKIIRKPLEAYDKFW